MTPLDLLLLRRTLAAIVLALGLTFAIVVSTDETTSTLPMRVARLAALAPLVALAAVLSIVAHARSRGELRAVESLGVTPWRAARGAALAALVTGAVGVVALLSPLADAASLFPAVRAAIDWSIEDGGRWARASGVVVAADGAMALASAASRAAGTGPSAVQALPCLLPVALVAPGWAVTPLPLVLRATTLVLSGALVVAVLHLVAAARIVPLWGALAAAPLALSMAAGRARG